MKETGKEFNFWVPLEDEGGFIEKASKTEKGDSKRYDNMYLQGMASNNAKDSEGEVLEPSGYDLSRFLKSGFINFEHKSKNDPKYLIGEPVSANIQGDEFHVKGKLYKESEIARNLWDTVIMMKKSDATRKLGWSIEGRATERSIVDPKRITKALITGIALTFNPVNNNSYADICKGEQKEDHIDYEYEDLIAKSETAKYIFTFESGGKNFGITKSFEVEEIQKDMNTDNTRALIPESLDKKTRVLEPSIKKAILNGLIEIKDIDRIEKGKKAVIGEIRTYSGVQYRKATETGNPNKDWVRVKKTEMTKLEPEAKKEDSIDELKGKLKDVELAMNNKSNHKNVDKMRRLDSEARGLRDKIKNLEPKKEEPKAPKPDTGILTRDDVTGKVEKINWKGQEYNIDDLIKDNETGHEGKIAAFQLINKDNLSANIIVSNLTKGDRGIWDLDTIKKIYKTKVKEPEKPKEVKPELIKPKEESEKSKVAKLNKISLAESFTEIKSLEDWLKKQGYNSSHRNFSKLKEFKQEFTDQSLKLIKNNKKNIKFRFKIDSNMWDHYMKASVNGYIGPKDGTEFLYMFEDEWNKEKKASPHTYNSERFRAQKLNEIMSEAGLKVGSGLAYSTIGGTVYLDVTHTAELG